MSETNFGYRQELNRTMSGFSSFAVSFSLISVLTGIFANFNFGFREVGGWILWSWTIVAIGQYLIAMVMARLSIRFPIAGYGYQWTSRLVNPHFGFFIGWMLLMQFLTGFPGIAQTAAISIAGFANLDVGENGIILLTISIIFFVTWIHIRGIKVASKVNDFGVYAELAGVGLLILMLAWVAGNYLPEGFLRISEGVNNETGFTPQFSSLALSLLLGTWCLTGFEAAADLAEETNEPEKTVPKAVTQSLLSAAIAGFLIIALLILAAGDIRDAQGADNSLIFILERSVGVQITSVIMIFVVISILACAVASMATASRLLFSMARDGMLPFSAWLSKVNAKTKTPQSSTWTVFILSCMAVLLFRRIEVITAVSALASFIGYAGIMYASIRAKISLVPALALIWSLVVIAALAIPETAISGIDTRHLPALSAVVVLVMGSLVYLLFVRKRLLAGQAGPPNIQVNKN